MFSFDTSKYTIITLDEVNSTNGYAMEHIKFFDDKTVIFTLRQTSGRGRYNRRWVCDDLGNISMSIVLKPDKDNRYNKSGTIGLYPFPNLTQYLSVILCRVLERDFDLEPSIKWPNDILVEGAKISGILAESYMENNTIKGVVLGLGVNVNLKKETLEQIDQKAVSLAVLKNKEFDAEEILRSICDSFFEDYDKFVKSGFSFIKDEYIQKCSFLGKNIVIRENGEKKRYFAKDIDNEGFLTVIDEFNNEGKIMTGDVLC